MTDAAKPRRRRRFVVAAVLLPIAAAALVETALRIVGVGADDVRVMRFVNPEGAYADEADGPVMRDPVLFWRLRPNAVLPGAPERIGATGFRTDFDVAKPAGVRRIVCLGDSNTFGFHVPADAAWPAALGRELRPSQDGRRWEALNLGVPGYTSWQERRWLETEGAALAPDVVVIEAGGFNEWLPAYDLADREQTGRPSGKRLRIVGLLSRVFARDAPTPANSRTADPSIAGYDGPVRVPPADFADDLRAVGAWCAAHGAQVVFVAHPLPAATARRCPAATRYADVVREVAAALDAPIADGWAAFAASGRSDAELFVDFCHPTELGHAVMAQAVRDAVERLR